MSALPPKADIERYVWHVRFVPKADKCAAANARLFDYLVGKGEHARGNSDAERLGGLEIDHQLELGG